MVITLDKRKKPLGFCTEKRARQLIEKGRACIHRYYPFTLIIKDLDVREMPVKDSYRIKIDPGSLYTGIAVIKNETNEVMLFCQLDHRSGQIRADLETRRNARKNRRSRETRYRKPKWGNKQKKKDSKCTAESDRPEGWLPPSVKSAADNIISWVRKLSRLINLTACSFEAVRFDSQLMDNPDIEGTEYQQGTLFGYELREYLLEKYGHTCQYCGGASGDQMLEWEHIVPKSAGGSDKVRNATLSCHSCNRAKGSKSLEDWKKEEKQIAAGDKKASKVRRDLAEARVSGIQKVMNGKQNGVSDRYSAWVNMTRKYIEKELYRIFTDVECASGGTTKYNRIMLGLPKDHHYDALCVGTVPQNGYTDRTGGYVLQVKAVGRGTRFRGKINACGIITVKLKKGPKRRFGYQNGDIVKAVCPKGKYAGTHVGRVMTRSSGWFDIRCTDGTKVTVNHKYCRILQRDDGYQYAYGKK